MSMDEKEWAEHQVNNDKAAKQALTMASLDGRDDLIQQRAQVTGVTPRAWGVDVKQALAMSDPRMGLAKALGKTVIPNAWPKLREGSTVLVVAEDGAFYAMKVWKLKGKQVTFLSLGKLEEGE